MDRITVAAMHLDPAERAAADILATVRAGGTATGLSELDPATLRQALGILAEYDASVLVGIAAGAIEQQASPQRHEATVHAFVRRRRG